MDQDWEPFRLDYSFFGEDGGNQVESFSRKDLASWLSVLIRIFPEGSFFTALTCLLKGLGSLSCKA